MNQQAVMLGFDPPASPVAKLQGKFIIPPFSVLDTRQGYWQERKKLWVSLGIQSELGRGEALLLQSEELRDESLNYYRKLNKARSYGEDIMRGERQYTRKEADAQSNLTNAPKKPDWATGTGTENMAPGTSIFDPVLCEIMYKWFAPSNGKILDPFSGGSVRGIVASILGYGYSGIDLSQDQIKANIKQAKEIITDNQPEWYQGNSKNMNDILAPDTKYDMIFSCPPYHDLEVYSDDMDDLSNMSWDAFKDDYADIIAKAILKLKDNRFAVFVVSEIRNGDGYFKGLVPWTIECFKNGGMKFYNEIILVNVVGSLPIRMTKQFVNRKIGRTHQNILCFYKGEAENIPRYFNEISGDIPDGNGGSL